MPPATHPKRAVVGIDKPKVEAKEPGISLLFLDSQGYIIVTYPVPFLDSIVELQLGAEIILNYVTKLGRSKHGHSESHSYL